MEFPVLRPALVEACDQHGPRARRRSTEWLLRADCVYHQKCVRNVPGVGHTTLPWWPWVAWRTQPPALRYLVGLRIGPGVTTALRSWSRNAAVGFPCRDS